MASEVAESRNQAPGTRQHAARSTQHAAGTRQHAAGTRQHAAGTRQHAAGTRQHAARSRHQAARAEQIIHGVSSPNRVHDFSSSQCTYVLSDDPSETSMDFVARYDFSAATLHLTFSSFDTCTKSSAKLPR